MRLPDGVLGMARRGPDWADWVDRLLPTLTGVLEEWELSRDGEMMHGYCALVVPVRTATGRAAVLKLTFDGDEESEHEHLALQRWHGHGAVELLRADPYRRVMLLERLHPETLQKVPVPEACEIVAGLYEQIHVPALPQLRTLTSYVDRWADDLDSLPRSAPVPHRLVRQAVSYARNLVTDPASTGTLIHGDLHYENVLAADRSPWLVIDPKPMSGDPHYELAPMLWNRFEEITAAAGSRSVRAGIRRRFHNLADASGLDEKRAREWVLVRMMNNACWRMQDELGTGRLTPDDEWLTMCVAIAKAVQD